MPGPVGDMSSDADWRRCPQRPTARWFDGRPSPINRGRRQSVARGPCIRAHPCALSGPCGPGSQTFGPCGHGRAGAAHSCSAGDAARTPARSRLTERGAGRIRRPPRRRR